MTARPASVRPRTGTPPHHEVRVVATVDLAAIRDNLARVRRYSGDARVMAAVKADAYGHGAVPVSKALVEGGVDALAVACLEEALILRRSGIDRPLVLLEGVLSAEEAAAACRLALQVVIHAPWQLELLATLPDGTVPALWFKLDTGMHRLGFSPRQANSLYARSVDRGWSLCGWMTHLACADEPGHPLTGLQLQRFSEALDGLPGARSIANSAALIDCPQARADWVRPGLALYGASPFADRDAAALGLRPAMNLDARLIAIQRVDAGETVGYGAAYRAARTLSIGIVAAGYADGVHRALPTGTPLLLGAERVPLVGRVSMDMLAVDLSSTPDARVGDMVRLWGQGLPAEQIAGYAGTLAYELFCGLTQRVELRYRG